MPCPELPVFPFHPKYRNLIIRTVFHTSHNKSQNFPRDLSALQILGSNNSGSVSISFNSYRRSMEDKSPIPRRYKIVSIYGMLHTKNVPMQFQIRPYCRMHWRSAAYAALCLQIRFHIDPFQAVPGYRIKLLPNCCIPAGFPAVTTSHPSGIACMPNVYTARTGA